MSIATINNRFVRLSGHRNERRSLSTYFPAGTQYFYSYPAGENSGFLNNVPPEVEELVAARAVSCAGPKISVVSFAATQAPLINHDLAQKLGLPRLPVRQMTLLPKKIDTSLKGQKRNHTIQAALEANIRPGSLVMAQPFTDSSLVDLYQISPQITAWLNDKSNMGDYIPAALRPKRLGFFENGAQFTKAYKKFELPCTVKVTSSSSGDGVHLCFSKQDLKAAAEELAAVKGAILVEKYIEAVKNFGIHFGIPYNSRKPIDILGVNEQITTPKGEFVGGIIHSKEFPYELLGVRDYLIHNVLPHIRRLGWYGIGGFDVLCDKKGHLFFIDCNFRMTGMSAYHMMVINGEINSPMLAFSGQFKGTRKQFEQKIQPMAAKDSPDKTVQIIALSQHKNSWNFNAALFFDNPKQLRERSRQLRSAGIASKALSQISKVPLD